MYSVCHSPDVLGCKLRGHSRSGRFVCIKSKPWLATIGCLAAEPNFLLLLVSKLSSLTLSNEVLFKLMQELQIKQVLRSQSLLTHHCFHCLDVFTNGITSILRAQTEVMISIYIKLCLQCIIKANAY